MSRDPSQKNSGIPSKDRHDAQNTPSDWEQLSFDERSRDSLLEKTETGNGGNDQGAASEEKEIRLDGLFRGLMRAKRTEHWERCQGYAVALLAELRLNEVPRCLCEAHSDLNRQEILEYAKNLYSEILDTARSNCE